MWDCLREGEATDLVRLARKEDSTTSDTQSTLLLLALLVDFRNGPGLDVICFQFVGCCSDAVRRVDIGTDRPWWLK